MWRVYFVGAAVVVGALLYWGGREIGDARCRADMAAADGRRVLQDVTQIIKVKEDVNAETVRTGVADIRRVLRENYTIAE